MSQSPRSGPPPRRRSPARGPERWLYLTGALVFGSGVGWLASHYLPVGAGDVADAPHPLEFWWLRLHGAAMMAFLIAVGALIPKHMTPSWRRRINHRSGLLMLAIVAILAVTGYGLYYLGDEETRPWISGVHWIAGLAGAAGLLAHRTLGRRRLRESRCAS